MVLGVCANCRFVLATSRFPSSWDALTSSGVSTSKGNTGQTGPIDNLKCNCSVIPTLLGCLRAECTHQIALVRNSSPRDSSPFSGVILRSMKPLNVASHGDVTELSGK